MHSTRPEAGAPLTVTCGGCHRTLGAMCWPAEPPADWSDPVAELDISDWLYSDVTHGGRRGPIVQAERARIAVFNSDDFATRIQTSCTCGHRGRLRLHKIPERVVDGVVAIP